ncbi:hypothetical protein RCH09_002650 [Actimicrobium sp. GrIS 1.19]|nr:hypothetical protein [Actimicrobium sp. GrIS 1.19]
MYLCAVKQVDRANYICIVLAPARGTEKLRLGLAGIFVDLSTARAGLTFVVDRHFHEKPADPVEHVPQLAAKIRRSAERESPYLTTPWRVRSCLEFQLSRLPTLPWAESRTKCNTLMDRSRFGLFQIVDNLAVDFERTAVVVDFVRPGIHLVSNGVEIILRQVRQVGAFGHVLAQQAIGVFIAAALPTTAPTALVGDGTGSTTSSSV